VVKLQAAQWRGASAGVHQLAVWQVGEHQSIVVTSHPSQRRLWRRLLLVREDVGSVQWAAASGSEADAWMQKGFGMASRSSVQETGWSTYGKWCISKQRRIRRRVDGRISWHWGAERFRERTLRMHGALATMKWAGLGRAVTRTTRTWAWTGPLQRGGPGQATSGLEGVRGCGHCGGGKFA
jgi:hypothetical protein